MRLAGGAFLSKALASCTAFCPYVCMFVPMYVCPYVYVVLYISDTSHRVEDAQGGIVQSFV